MNMKRAIQSTTTEIMSGVWKLGKISAFKFITSSQKVRSKFGLFKLKI